MLDEDQLKALSQSANNQSTGAAKSVDDQINENIQKKEIDSMKQTFYQTMKDNYVARKNKEYITLACSNFCLNKAGASYKEDSLARQQK